MLGFHPVELCDVSLLELGGSRSVESHSQEGEAVAGHEVHGVGSAVARNGVGRELKIQLSKFFRAIKQFDSLHDVLVFLPENLGHLEGGGHRDVAGGVDGDEIGGNDGGGIGDACLSPQSGCGGGRRGGG